MQLNVGVMRHSSHNAEKRSLPATVPLRPRLAAGMRRALTSFLRFFDVKYKTMPVKRTIKKVYLSIKWVYEYQREILYSLNSETPDAACFTLRSVWFFMRTKLT